MKVFNTGNEYQRYPPSILIVKDTSSDSCTLKQALETNGCQVHQIDNISCLDTMRQQYFDLVVLDIEHPEVVADIDDLSVPALAGTSLVWLTSAAQAENEQLLASRMSLPVCCMAKDVAAEALLPLIKQKHYITYRYM